MTEDRLKDITFSPIGYFVSEQIEPYQAARQPDEYSKSGSIRLNSKMNFEQALTNLEGCTHIWIIYHFHKNPNWKPLVQTPRSDKKIGVFATRAPYRPNAIGMSVVTLEKIFGLEIFVGPNDILNGTPILDIKPYHPESDVIQDSKIDWLNESSMTSSKKYKINFSPFAAEQVDFLNSNNLKELEVFILRQLEFDPTNSDKKRVSQSNALWTLAYRTWRADFVVTDDLVSVIGIHSGYTENELANTEDLYLDKDLHKKFNRIFN